MKPTIDVINESTAATDAEVSAWAEAWQQQVTNDFAPVWGVDATINFVPKGAKPDPEAWWMVGLDNSDQAGALGYHDLTPAGQPIGKFFIGTDKQYGYDPGVTGSHEVLEMLGDPGIQMTVQAADPQGNVIFLAYENCDAVENDSFGYKIGNVQVSDFVYPTWFGGVAGTQYDHCGHVKAPYQLLPGGYISVFTLSQGWGQITARREAADTFDLMDMPISKRDLEKSVIPLNSERPPVGSRRERRQVGPTRWIRSTAHA